MNDRFEPPRDYVVRPARQPLRTRYERVQELAGFVLLAALIIGVIVLMAYSTTRADAAVGRYHAPPCAVHNNTPGACPTGE